MPDITPDVKWIEIEEDDDDITKEDDEQIGIQIHINKYKDVKNRKEVADLIYCEHQIFVAVTTAILMACPGTMIDVITSMENLTSVKEVQASSYKLEDYLEISNTNGRVWFGRIYIRSAQPFYIMRQNNMLKMWLKEEKMDLEVNNLDAIRLENVGMFVDCHPKDQLFHIHEYYLRQIFPEKGTPEFMLQTWYMNIHDNPSGTTLLLQTAPEHVQTMYYLIETYESIIIMTFILWKQWRPLQPGKKLTIFNEQISYMNRLKRLCCKISLMRTKENLF
jgi:hypothetical protein